MKNYAAATHPHQQQFNKALTKSRQVIEIAFGHLKGRWRILTRNFIRDPQFVTSVAMVCAALHNVCERANFPFDDTWCVDKGNYTLIGPRLPPLPLPNDMAYAQEVRLSLATNISLPRGRI